MTNKEAAKNLRGACLALPGECDCSKDQDCALQKAIKALEKQVPKRPLYRGGWRACPSCTTATSVTLLTKGESFCYICGQKIDWGRGDNNDQ